MTIIAIPISQLRYSKDVWPRFGADEERISLFAELFINGESVPAIEVVADGEGCYLIADGMHRTYAARRARLEAIESFVVEPEPGETPAGCAYRRALDTATKAALPLFKAERRHAAIRLIDTHPDLSHRAIARMVGVSHDSVDRWAKEAQSSESNESILIPDMYFPQPMTSPAAW